MNKGFRVILIAGATALLVGVLLIVAGIVSGAKWTDVRDVVFSGKYSFGSTNKWGWGLSANDVLDGDKLNGKSNVLKDIDAKSIEKLTISMAAGELNIQAGESEYFQVDNQENRGDCYIEHDGNELTVTIRGKHKNSVGARTTFWIPKGLKVDDLEISTDAGKVQSEALSATNIKLSVGAGQIKTEAIDATNLAVEVDAGEFKSNGKITTEEATLKVAAGNLKVDLLEAKNADAKVDVGHINIKFVGDESDYNIDADCDVGEVRINGGSYHMGKEYQSHDSTTGKTIEVECNVGQATIDFEN